MTNFQAIFTTCSHLGEMIMVDMFTKSIAYNITPTYPRKESEIHSIILRKHFDRQILLPFIFFIRE